MESLYTALKNIDRADIVTSLEGQAPQPAPGTLEEGACRLSDRDSTLLSPSVINGKYHTHTYWTPVAIFRLFIKEHLCYSIRFTTAKKCIIYLVLIPYLKANQYIRQGQSEARSFHYSYLSFESIFMFFSSSAQFFPFPNIVFAHSD